MALPAKADDLLAAHIANPQDLHLAERAAVSLASGRKYRVKPTSSLKTSPTALIPNSACACTMPVLQRTNKGHSKMPSRPGQVLKEDQDHEAAQQNVTEAVKQEIAQRLAEDQERQQESQDQDSGHKILKGPDSQSSESQDQADSVTVFSRRAILRTRELSQRSDSQDTNPIRTVLLRTIHHRMKQADAESQAVG